MILLVSGEGPSDIGTHDGAGKFAPGPIYGLIEQIVEPIWGYSPINSAALKFLSEKTLSQQCRTIKKGLSLPGKKRNDKGTAYFFKNARGLAKHAQELEATEECEVSAILFRDADGTQSTVKGLWEAKHQSMENGFLAENFQRGVPMVPKPKSESWLLCALQENPYTNCSKFETISGNDKSPNPAKDMLGKRMSELGRGDPNTGSLNDAVNDGSIDAQSIDMPSFNVFKARLEEVAKTMVGKPTI